MKKTTLISAAVAALGLTAAAAMAADPRDDRWERLDANGDGELRIGIAEPIRRDGAVMLSAE